MIANGDRNAANVSDNLPKKKCRREMTMGKVKVSDSNSHFVKTFNGKGIDNMTEKQRASLSKSSCAPILARVGSCLRGRCLWSYRSLLSLLFRWRLFWKIFIVSLRITPRVDVSKQSRHLGDEMFSIIGKLHRDLSSILQHIICQLQSVAIMPWHGLCTTVFVPRSLYQQQDALL
jgi:hypothetical protein